jgi:CheY-like chemotaxis protein
MPIMDGNTLAERISRSENPFPLIALSSDDSSHAVSDFFAHHIAKPYDDRHLLETIIQVLKLTKHSSNETSPETSSEERYRKPIAISSDEEEEDLDEICDAIQKKNSLHSTQKNIKTIQHKRVQADFYERAENTNIRILVVEDQEYNSIMIVKMLKMIGYHDIETAYSGEEAIELVRKSFRTRPYDIVLMDIIMPGKYDGVEASKRIVKMHDKSKPKIIAVTASIFDGAIEKYMMDGQMDGYITKPIDQIQRITTVFRKLGFT